MKAEAKVVYLKEAPLRLTKVNVQVPFKYGVLILSKSEPNPEMSIEERITNIYDIAVRVEKISEEQCLVLSRCRITRIKEGEKCEVEYERINETRPHCKRSDLYKLAPHLSREHSIIDLLDKTADFLLLGEERWEYFLSTNKKYKVVLREKKTFDPSNPAALLKDLPLEAQEEVEKQLVHYQYADGKEKAVIIDWFHWMSKIPWQAEEPKEYTLQEMRGSMDETHYGLKNVKDAITNQVALQLVKGKTAAGDVMCFVGPPSTGKAQPLDEVVLTPNGWKQIGKLKVGEAICSPTTPNAKVLGVFKQGKLEIYKVTFSDGTSTRCCMNHLWLAKSPAGEERVVSLKEICSYRMEDWKFPFYIPDSTEQFNEEAYLEGLEGAVTMEDSTKPTPWRVGKLKGLMDKHGRIRRYSNWLPNTQANKALVQSLGGTAVASERRLMVTTHFNPFRMHQSRWCGVVPEKSIISVEPCGEHEACCISVTGELYITSDFIVTHNTTIADSIGRAMQREVVKISLGSVSDEAVIRGHRRTYVAARPGRVITALSQCKSNDPIMILDEVDKCSYRLTGALLELLDPEQNKRFVDQYLEVGVDLSNVTFICTANDEEEIPPPLKNRMQIIEFSPFTKEELVKITKEFIIPNESVPCVSFTEEMIERLAELKTTREIKQKVKELVGRACREHLETGQEVVTVLDEWWEAKNENSQRIGFSQ